MNSILTDYHFVDLTHTLSSNTPHWEGKCGFKLHVAKDYHDYTSNTKFRDQIVEMHAGIGTHMDAPAHCIAAGQTIADIPLDKLINPCVVIDVSHKANESYQLSLQDIMSFEQQWGQITDNTFVIIHTGWSQYWSTPEKYRNNLVFPSVSAAAAEYLLSRNIAGLGIDTLSPDCPENDFPVHQLILGAGKFIVENIANADQLHALGSWVLVMPIKIQYAAEAPIRLIGLNKK